MVVRMAVRCGAVALITSLFGIAAGVAHADKIYWTDASFVIKRSNFDGTSIETFMNFPSVFPNNTSPAGIAADSDAGKLYWSVINLIADRIERANFDGSTVEILIDTGLGNPRDVDIDVAAGKLYWVDPSVPSRIGRVNFDGSSPEILVSSTDATPQPSPQDIALDVAGGKMYWADTGVSGVRRANLDGTSIETLITGGNNPQAVALDLSAGKFYWANGNPHRIERANLDGSSPETPLTGLSFQPLGLALDAANAHLYWIGGTGAQARIRRANTDGTGAVDIVSSELMNPQKLVLQVDASDPPAEVPALSIDRLAILLALVIGAGVVSIGRRRSVSA